MNKNQIAVVLPIYKEETTPFEEIALKQCFSILYEYPLIFVSSKKMENGIFHKQYCNRAQFVFLENIHFESIKTYNSLMLSEWFYEFFLSYNYILIYQLDCFVFKDELKIWADKGYSFIGAPWFLGESEGGNTDEIIGVGNGGFSLRNVKDCIRILNSSKKVFLFSEYVSKMKCSNKSLVLLRSLKHFILKPDKIYYSFKTIRNYSFINEDEIFAMAGKRFEFFKVPDAQVALSFAFEKQPKKAYQLNNNQLPFGCHAWNKYGINFYRPFFKHFGFEIE